MAERQTRVGWGFDAHRFGTAGPVVLCGVEVDQTRGIEATSDGDVAVHALMDALLGAVGIGDLGTYFHSEDPEMEGRVEAMPVFHGIAEHSHSEEMALSSGTACDPVRKSPTRS